MFTTSLVFALGALSLFSPASAQTWTYCNPLNATCPGDMALGTASTFNFTNQTSSLRVEDASTGSLYTYGDHSGSYESIKTTPGTSPLATYLLHPHNTSLPLNTTTPTNSTTSPLAAPIAKFEGLSRGAQIGIIVGAASAAAILFGLLTWCCCRQRKAGRHEKEIADFEFRKNEEELMQYRSMMGQGRGYVQVPERAVTPVQGVGKEGW